jgi:putative acetyltransferase
VRAGIIEGAGGVAMNIQFRVDDLSAAATQALVRRHLAGMHENSPPESVHAFDLDKLRQPGVTFWSGWVSEEIAVMGALKRLDAANGEIKSMRVADAYLGKGAGRAMLMHILGEARGAGLTSVWLETGSTAAFAPALRLYESAGFERCGPFGDYAADPFSVFMRLVLKS